MNLDFPTSKPWVFLLSIAVNQTLPFQVVLVVKNPPANTEDPRDTGSIPGSERSPGGGHGNPFLHSCLENPTDRGAWWATIHGVTKSRTHTHRLTLSCKFVPLPKRPCVLTGEAGETVSCVV